MSLQTAKSIIAANSIFCFSATCTFVFDQFPAQEIQFRAHKLSEISMLCKAHFKTFQFSYSVYIAGMYKSEVIST